MGSSGDINSAEEAHTMMHAATAPVWPSPLSVSYLALRIIPLTFPLAVDFETFQRVLNRPGGFRDPGEPEEYCRGFQVFDKDMTGFIGVGQLKYILTNLGEKMTDDEVDELLKAVDTSSGQVNYTGKRSALPPAHGHMAPGPRGSARLTKDTPRQTWSEPSWPTRVFDDYD